MLIIGFCDYNGSVLGSVLPVAVTQPTSELTLDRWMVLRGSGYGMVDQWFASLPLPTAKRCHQPWRRL